MSGDRTEAKDESEAVLRGGGVELVLLDIEGTVSPTEAILGQLYDYARPRLSSLVDRAGKDATVHRAVEETARSGGVDAEDHEAVTRVLLGWMDEDVKATPLKTLQGLIWAEGFDKGELTAELFDDVLPALYAWRAGLVRLAVFSSGSVASQRAWFGHSREGDLLSLFDGFYDTASAGPKKDPASYEKIAQQLRIEPDRGVFLSDVPAELDAAAVAGWQPIGVARVGEPNEKADFSSHPVVSSFAGLSFGAER